MYTLVEILRQVVLSYLYERLNQIFISFSTSGVAIISSKHTGDIFKRNWPICINASIHKHKHNCTSLTTKNFDSLYDLFLIILRFKCNY